MEIFNRSPLELLQWKCNSSGTGSALKKARIQATPPGQTQFKVRKEKLGERIVALHQLVSPFGKTDTASVYIRFLQSQIEVMPSFHSQTNQEYDTHSLTLKQQGITEVIEAILENIPLYVDAESAHQRLIICPSNVDSDLICCLTINLIYLVRDRRRTAQNRAMDILKYLLLHRHAALEELLVSKPSQGQVLDVLHGGFDKLLTGSSSGFYEWLHKSEQIVRKVLEKCSAIMWVKYIAGSAKFPVVRIKGMEVLGVSTVKPWPLQKCAYF